MPEAKMKEIADAADMVVNGYAYTRVDDNIRVLNLRTGKAAFVTSGHEVSETNMDDLDLGVAMRYLIENEQFMR
jgi:hypothetical protein